MAFNISDFRSSIGAGVQRQNRWEVEVQFPTYAGDVADVTDASLQARSTATPGWTLGKIDLPWQGRQIPIPGDRTFEDFTLTFVSVQDNKVRDAFEKWSNAINGLESNQGLAKLEDFMRDITLYLLNQNGNRIKSYTLKDAWPLELGSIDLDMDSADAAAIFTVTFSYVTMSSNTTS
ncbi:MAG: phage tail protein [Candidatus Peribacteraceae bacterium]|nr:phage tail protein [Candidatus Peribacteraceae bacterium]